MALEITSVAHVGGVPERARKGTNASHIMMTAPVVLGSWDVKGICTTPVGSSGDSAVTMGTDLDGAACKRCEKIYAGMVERRTAELATGADAREEIAVLPTPMGTLRIVGTPVAEPTEDERAELVAAERARRAERKAKRDAARENSAPTLPGVDVIASTGLTAEVMAEQVAAYYANGGAVPAEIATLPDPSVSRAWDVSAEGDGDSAYIPCDGAGAVRFVNAERTHGKCTGCSAYIELLPGGDDPDDNRIGSHFAGGIKAPANRKALSSRSVDTVEHGSTPGSPADALKRRTGEIKCPKSRRVIKGASGGTVTCPNEECKRPVELKKRVGKKGITWYVPDHSLPGELIIAVTVGKPGTAPVERKITPRGEGRDLGMNVREHGSVSGSANVGAQDMPPVRPGGWLGKAGTMSLPAMVRPGIDPEVTGKVCPLPECGGRTVDVAHAGKSKSWRRRHSAKIGAVLRERVAKRDAARAAEIANGEAIPVAERRERRKAASIGSFAEGVNAHTGAVTHGPREGKPVAPKNATETRGERAARRKTAKAAV